MKKKIINEEAEKKNLTQLKTTGRSEVKIAFIIARKEIM